MSFLNISNFVLDLASAIASFLAATWWMSSATKTEYAKHPKRSQEERESLATLAVDRNVKAAMAASVAAFCVCFKYVFSFFHGIGMI